MTAAQDVLPPDEEPELPELPEPPHYSANPLEAWEPSEDLWDESQMLGYGLACYEAGRASQEAELERLRRDGPPMARGHTGNGKVWMGTMRDVLNDYREAADVEAKWGDEARAEVKALRAAAGRREST